MSRARPHVDEAPGVLPAARAASEAHRAKAGLARMSEATRGNTARLSTRERRFLLAVIEGRSGAEAYLAIAVKPGLTTERARATASRMLARIKQKVDWPQFLEQAGLGDARLLTEIEARLRARFTKFYQDKSVGDFEDNAVRMRATELLAELLGRRKGELTIHHDLVQVIPAPRPEEQPRDEDGGPEPTGKRT